MADGLQYRCAADYHLFFTIFVQRVNEWEKGGFLFSICERGDAVAVGEQSPGCYADERLPTYVFTVVK